MSTTKNIKRLISKILLGLVLTVSLAMILPGPAMAQEEQADNDQATEQTTDSTPAVPPSSDAEYMELMKDLGTALILVSEFLQRIIWPVLLLIGGLLKNDILFAAGMEETMLAIWRNIRNIVNILFILILLGIAFYNVVGGSSQDYHIKTILPKFVIALIAVNFSFLAVKVVVDGVSVVTTAIFALPNAVSSELKAPTGQNLTQSEQFILDFCNNSYLENNKYEPPEDSYCVSGTQQRKLSEKGMRFFRTFDSNNAAIVLAINMGKVAEINKVKLKDFENAVKSMLINVLFSTMLYIVYAVAFVAMLIVLVVRMVVLWVTMVLSPLIVLKYVIPESLKSSFGGGDELGKKFIQNAIVPIPIALVMSIGFIMLQSWKQAKFGSFDIATTDLNLLTSGMSTLQDLIGAVAMVVVIWVGVFTAANGTYAKGITDGLKTAVEGAGKFVASAPFRYMPIIPVGTSGEKVSVGTVLGGVSQLPQVLDARERRKQSDFLENTLGFKSDESMDKRIRDQKDGTGLGAAILNDGSRYGSTQWKELGDKLRSDAKSERELLQHLGDFTHNNKTARQILDDIKAGKTIPSDTANAMANRLNGIRVVRTRADALRAEESSAPIPPAVAAGGAVAPAAGAAAGATAAAQKPGDNPAAVTEPPNRVAANNAINSGAQKDDLEKNQSEAIRARDTVEKELNDLERFMQGASSSRSAEDIKSNMEQYRQRIDAALQTAYPDEGARAQKVVEIMEPIVRTRDNSDDLVKALKTPPPAPSAPPAQQPPTVPPT